ncbi:MAG TPA: universal stress protein [Desulfotignum sp.]|nr:universal stress protein [Desulfotignum sp.]
MNGQAKKILKIMVAIDFSAYSRDTLEYAVQTAALTDARMVLLNIINQKQIDAMEKAVNTEHPNRFDLARFLGEEMDRRKMKLKTLTKGIPMLDDMPVKIRIGHGVPHVEILEAVKRENADFLVFGPKGRTDFKEFLFGSVAEKLFRHSPVPVMSIRS